MNTIIFDGKKFASEKASRLKELVLKQGKKGSPVLFSLLVGDNDASKLYLSLKEKAIANLGGKMETSVLSADASKEEVMRVLKSASENDLYTGVMLQLPLPEGLYLDSAEILTEISPSKDVDGLLSDSPFTPAVVRAVDYVVMEAEDVLSRSFKTMCVVGSKGEIGRRIFNHFSDRYSVFGIDMDTSYPEEICSSCDVVVCASGKASLVTGSYIGENSVVIDLGAPKPEAFGVVGKAGFVTPVPGGIGPVTVYCLVENLFKAFYTGVTLDEFGERG